MKLSIITINYNNKAGLQKTIESVMSQTWRDFEWIIIDGGSTDGSEELIIQAATDPDSNISFWCSEPDKGIYDAMNKGITHAKGEYINFMNSGDYFYDVITTKKVFSENKLSDILYGDWIEQYVDRENLRRIPLKELGYTLLNQNICHQAIFVKSYILKQETFNPDEFGLIADWGRLTKMILAGKSIEYLGIPICRYDMSGLTSKNVSDLSKQYQKILDLYPGIIKDSLYELKIIKNDFYISEFIKLSQRRIIGRFLRLNIKILSKIHNLSK